MPSTSPTGSSQDTSAAPEDPTPRPAEPAPAEVPASTARRSAKRDAVLAAALRCFEREGFHRASMAAVIEEAGVSAGTVYRYFPSKTDLIRACAEEVFGNVDAELLRLEQQDPPPQPADVLPQLIAAGLDVGNRFGVDLTRIGVTTWTEALRDPLVMEQVQQRYGRIRSAITVLAAGWATDAGLSEDDVDVAAVGQALFGAIPGFVLQHLIFGDLTPEQYGRGLKDLGRIIAGLAAPDGTR